MKEPTRSERNIAKQKESRKRGKHLKSPGEMISDQAGGAEPDPNFHRECRAWCKAAARHWCRAFMAKHHLTREMGVKLIKRHLGKFEWASRAKML